MAERINTVKIKTETDVESAKKNLKKLQAEYDALDDKSTKAAKALELKIKQQTNNLQRYWDNVKKAQNKATDGIKEYGDVLQRASGKRAMVSNFADSFNDILNSSNNAAGAIRNVGSVATEVGFAIGGAFGPIGLVIGGITSALVIAGEQFDIFGTKAEEAADEAAKTLAELIKNDEKTNKAKLLNKRLDEESLILAKLKTKQAEDQEKYTRSIYNQGVLAERQRVRLKANLDKSTAEYEAQQSIVESIKAQIADLNKNEVKTTQKKVDLEKEAAEHLKKQLEYQSQAFQAGDRLSKTAPSASMPDMPKNISAGLSSTDGSSSSQAIKEDVEANMQLANSIAFVQECLAGAATTAGELGTAYKALTAVSKGLAIAEAGLALASAIKTAGETGDPYTVAIRVAAAAGAVTAAIASMSTMRFSQGGIVSGGASSGDFTMIRANAGEMVLNNKQQSNLFRMINEGATGGKEISVNVSLDSRQISSAINKAKIRNSSMK